MTLKDAKTAAAGLEISDFDTNTEKTGIAEITFTYETKKYTMQLPYSVTKWKAQLYMPDGTKFPQVFTPDKNLRLNLDRYYKAFVSMYPKFIGWRCEGSDEIYTTECVMTSPYMELFACIGSNSPSQDDVGEEYKLTGMTDADLSDFGVYPDCKKIIIGKDVRNITTDLLSEKFPNLEEIETEEGSSVYTSYDGALYKGSTLAVVPPKKTQIEIADGTQKIGDYAFCRSEITELVLAETVTEIGKYAFMDAKLETLTITALKYSVDEGAFCSSNEEQPAVSKIISKTLYTAAALDGAENFGKALPGILLPDSKYDRVYQYYLSSWGYKIDEKYGAGSAVSVFSTETGAQERNALIDGAAYSFLTRQMNLR